MEGWDGGGGRVVSLCVHGRRVGVCLGPLGKRDVAEVSERCGWMTKVGGI